MSLLLAVMLLTLARMEILVDMVVFALLFAALDVRESAI